MSQQNGGITDMWGANDTVANSVVKCRVVIHFREIPFLFAVECGTAIWRLTEVYTLPTFRSHGVD